MEDARRYQANMHKSFDTLPLILVCLFWAGCTCMEPSTAPKHVLPTKVKTEPRSPSFSISSRKSEVSSDLWLMYLTERKKDGKSYAFHNQTELDTFLSKLPKGSRIVQQGPCFGNALRLGRGIFDLDVLKILCEKHGLVYHCSWAF